MERQLLRKEASHDLDRLQLLIDVSELGISGYQAADWLRETKAVDVGLSDHRRILATLSMADDATDHNTTARSTRRVDQVGRVLSDAFTSRPSQAGRARARVSPVAS